MLPISPLMIEHRFIERMIIVMREGLQTEFKSSPITRGTLFRPAKPRF